MTHGHPLISMHVLRHALHERGVRRLGRKLDRDSNAVTDYLVVLSSGCSATIRLENPIIKFLGKFFLAAARWSRFLRWRRCALAVGKCTRPFVRSTSTGRSSRTTLLDAPRIAQWSVRKIRDHLYLKRSVASTQSLNEHDGGSGPAPRRQEEKIGNKIARLVFASGAPTRPPACPLAGKAPRRLRLSGMLSARGRRRSVASLPRSPSKTIVSSPPSFSTGTESPEDGGRRRGRNGGAFKYRREMRVLFRYGSVFVPPRSSLHISHRSIDATPARDPG